MLQPDLVLLKTIKMFVSDPVRLRYSRCWGCGKRRVFGQWWEGYQSTNGEANPAALAHWGWFCSSCIVIVACGIMDSLRFARDTVRIEALDEALDQFDCEVSDSAAVFYERVVALQESIEADQQQNGY